MHHKKSVLFTGGGEGIGAGICRRLAKDGYAVTVILHKERDSS